MAKKKVGKRRSATPKLTRGSTRNTRQAAPPPPTHAKSTRRGERGLSIELIARGVLIDRGRVLCCQNLKHGNYYLPGGHVEFAEPAAVALQREFIEECGLPVLVGPLLQVDEHSFATRKREHHEINLVFLVEPNPSAAARAARTKNGGKRGSRSSPDWRDIHSQEKGLKMAWLDLAAITDVDFRPVSAKALLLSAHVPNEAHGRSSAASHHRHAPWVSHMTLA